MTLTLTSSSSFITYLSLAGHYHHHMTVTLDQLWTELSLSEEFCPPRCARDQRAGWKLWVVQNIELRDG